MSDAQHRKNEIRSQMRSLLKGVPKDKRVHAGEKVAEHVELWFSFFPVRESLSIAFFKAFSDEIDTESLDALFTKLHACRYLPYINGNNVLCFVRLKEHNAIDLFDMRKAEDIDVIFVPGLAFDMSGHRLGRGKGYYDRALSELRSEANKGTVIIGLAMDEQLVSQIPCEAHDVSMDYICTPTLGMFPIR